MLTLSTLCRTNAVMFGWRRSPYVLPGLAVGLGSENLLRSGGLLGGDAGHGQHLRQAFLCGVVAHRYSSVSPLGESVLCIVIRACPNLTWSWQDIHAEQLSLKKETPSPARLSSVSPSPPCSPSRVRCKRARSDTDDSSPPPREPRTRRECMMAKYRRSEEI
jgi:hypothetical protein